MSNIQTGAERMPHDLSHLGFLAGQIGRLITISTTPVIAGDSFEMDAVGALRLSPLRRGLAIDSTVDIFTFYVPHRHVYGEQWIKFMKDGVNATPLPPVNTTGYIDHAAFLGTINPDTNKIPKHLFQGYLNIYNNYFKAPWMPDRTEANPNELNQDDARYGFRCCHLKNIWTAPLPPETELSRQMLTSTTSIDLMGLQAAYANLHTDQERDYFMQRYHDVISSFGGKTSYDADNRPLLVMRSNLWASGYDVDGTDQTSLGQFCLGSWDFLFYLPGQIEQSFQLILQIAQRVAYPGGFEAARKIGNILRIMGLLHQVLQRLHHGEDVVGDRDLAAVAKQPRPLFRDKFFHL